jgi:hypothetical protein
VFQQELLHQTAAAAQMVSLPVIVYCALSRRAHFGIRLGAAAYLLIGFVRVLMSPLD